MSYKKILNATYEIAFMLSLFFLVFGMYAFFIGFHNIDLCRNEKILSYECDLEIMETTNKGTVWDLDTCYVHGLRQIIKGFFISITSSFFLAYFFKLVK